MKLLDSIHEAGAGAKCLITLAAVAAALLIGGVFISILHVNPLEAYYYLLIRPFRSFRSIGEISVKLVPILIVGLGVSFTFQAKLSNLGGEGQICLGAIGMTIVGISPFAKAIGPVWILFGLLAAAVFGALWAGIAGFFKTQFKASEIITTLLLNYIAVQFLSYCVYYPLRDSKGNIPQSAKVASTLPKLFEGSRMNAGILIALAGLLIYWIVIKKTSFGYRLRVLGGSIRAAAFGGISEKKYCQPCLSAAHLQALQAQWRLQAPRPVFWKAWQVLMVLTVWLQPFSGCSIRQASWCPPFFWQPCPQAPRPCR